MTKQPEALLAFADRIEEAQGKPIAIDPQAAAELRRLHEENQRLKTVMIAAAEELAKHWDAHCDAEGYGPVNLMRRLEKGIASEYNYTAGSFARLHEVNQELLEALKELKKVMPIFPKDGDVLVGYKDRYNAARFKASAAITKATGEQA